MEDKKSSLSSNQVLLYIFIFLIITIGAVYFLNDDNPKKKNTSFINESDFESENENEPETNSDPVNTTNNDDPSKSLIESEVIYIVNNISPDYWKYNASTFIGQDGVFKNLNVTNSEILSRSALQNIDGFAQQTIQIKITGIMDRYTVGGGLPPSLIPQGRGNFIVEKEFVFKKKNDKWIGYINDNARQTMSRSKKVLMR